MKVINIYSKIIDDLFIDSKFLVNDVEYENRKLLLQVLIDSELGSILQSNCNKITFEQLEPHFVDMLINNLENSTQERVMKLTEIASQYFDIEPTPGEANKFMQDKFIELNTQITDLNNIYKIIGELINISKLIRNNSSYLYIKCEEATMEVDR